MNPIHRSATVAKVAVILLLITSCGQEQRPAGPIQGPGPGGPGSGPGFGGNPQGGPGYGNPGNPGSPGNPGAPGVPDRPLGPDNPQVLPPDPLVGPVDGIPESPINAPDDPGELNRILGGQMYPYFRGFRHQMTGEPIFTEPMVRGEADWLIQSRVGWREYHHALVYFRNLRSPRGYLFPGRRFVAFTRHVYHRYPGFRIVTFQREYDWCRNRGYSHHTAVNLAMNRAGFRDIEVNIEFTVWRR